MPPFDSISGWIYILIGLVGAFFCIFAAGGFALGMVSGFIISAGIVLVRIG